MSTTTFPIYRGPSVEARGIRLLRGQVVIREQHDNISPLILTVGKRRGQEGRTGTVLAMGPPSYFDYSGRCVEVPYLFDVGDRVVFAWVSNPDHYTLPWPIDGLEAAWVPQGAVLGVLE